MEKNGPWMKKWFIFENGELKFGNNPLMNERDFQKIHMNDVISFKTDVSNLKSSMQHIILS